MNDIEKELHELVTSLLKSAAEIIDRLEEYREYLKDSEITCGYTLTLRGAENILINASSMAIFLKAEFETNEGIENKEETKE